MVGPFWALTRGKERAQFGCKMKTLFRFVDKEHEEFESTEDNDHVLMHSVYEIDGKLYNVMAVHGLLLHPTCNKVIRLHIIPGQNAHSDK